jgi:hypothetical protein
MVLYNFVIVEGVDELGVPGATMAAGWPWHDATGCVPCQGTAEERIMWVVEIHAEVLGGANEVYLSLTQGI